MRCFWSDKKPGQAGKVDDIVGHMTKVLHLVHLVCVVPSSVNIHTIIKIKLLVIFLHVNFAGKMR